MQFKKLLYLWINKLKQLEIMSTLNEQIKRGYILFTYHANQPQADILTIVKETEKALQVEHEYTKKLVWLPKSVFIDGDYGALTVKNWFKKKVDKWTLINLNVRGL